MPNKFIGIGGRHENSAKEFITDGAGVQYTRLGGSKKLIFQGHDISISSGDTWKKLSIEKELSSSELEVVVVLADVDRFVGISPVFGLQSPNGKTNIMNRSDLVYHATSEINRRETILSIPVYGDLLDFISFKTDDGKKMLLDLYIWEVYSPQKSVYGTYVHHELVAEETPKSITIDVAKIKYITNDGNNDIFISFDHYILGSVNEKYRIRLKPGETLNDIEIPTQKLFYNSGVGSQLIRIMGVK